MTADLDAVRAMLEGEPIAWRVRVKGDDPEEWVLLKAGGGADYLDRPGYECQPLYDSAARDLVPALAADLAATRAALAEAQGALIWCSGSPDFNEGGQAREGWLRVCAPLLKGTTP